MEIPFTNREIASAILILVFACWMLRFPPVREAVRNLIKCALSPTLSLPAALTGLWIAFGVSLLAHFILWDSSLLKETILWSLFSGISSLFSGANSPDPNRAFLANFKKQFKWAVLLVFLYNLVDFPLLVEIPILLVLTFFGILQEVCKREEAHQSVAKFCDNLLSLIGLVLIGAVVWSIIKNPAPIVSPRTLQSFVLPFFLLLWTSPFAYLLSVKFAYNDLFVRLHLKKYLEKDLSFYVAINLAGVGILNASRVKRLNKLLGRKTDDLKSHDDIDDLFSQLRVALKDRDNQDSRDFIWPPPKLYPGEVRYDSNEDYLEMANPILDELTQHYRATVNKFERVPEDGIISKELETFLTKLWDQIDAVYQRVHEMDRAPLACERFDRELRSFNADLHQIFWFHSPENEHITEPTRLNYLVFSNFNRIEEQFQRVLLASEKLTKSLNLS